MANLLKQDKRKIIELRNIIEHKSPTKIYCLYCYGSCVNQHRIDADFDILLITKDDPDWRTEKKIIDIIIDFGIDNDIVFDPQVLSKRDFEKTLSVMPFIENVNREGVKVWSRSFRLKI